MLHLTVLNKSIEPRYIPNSKQLYTLCYLLVYSLDSDTCKNIYVCKHNEICKYKYKHEVMFSGCMNLCPFQTPIQAFDGSTAQCRF